MRLVFCPFASPVDFLDSFSFDRPEGVLFVRTRSRLAAAEDVLCEVSFPGVPDRTLVRATVSAVRPDRGLWMRLWATEAHSRDFLVGLARGVIAPSEPVERSHPRIPAALPAMCRIDEPEDPAPTDRLFGHTQDVGGGGAFIYSPEPPAVGTRVSVVLGPTGNGGDTFNLDGQVAWIRRCDRGGGFGVRFDPRGDQDGRRLRVMLRRAWESGRVEFASSTNG